MSAMRYVGNGAFHIGVPARDLTAAEADLYSETIAGSSLYEAIAQAGAEVLAPAQDEQPAGEAAAMSRKRSKGE